MHGQEIVRETHVATEIVRETHMTTEIVSQWLCDVHLDIWYLATVKRTSTCINYPSTGVIQARPNSILGNLLARNQIPDWEVLYSNCAINSNRIHAPLFSCCC